MFDTPAEMKKVIKQSESDQDLLRIRMQEHFDYAVGRTYETAKGYEQYTSTAPQTFFEKITDGLNRAELSIQIKLSEDAEEKERREASLAELFLFGAHVDIDRNLQARGWPPLRECLGFFISTRGWYSLKTVVYIRKGETYFDVQAWDPLHVTYEYGSSGLIWIANSRWASAAELNKEFPDASFRGKGAEIVDFWDGDRNSIFVNNTFVKNPEEHNLDAIPILHGAVGSQPTVQDKDYNPTLEFRGHSIYHSAAHTFEPFNKYVSQLMDIHKKSIVGSIIHASKTGKKKLGRDPHREYMEIQTEEGESIEMLKLQVVPEVTSALLGILDTEKQQSMLPYPLAYGGTQDPLSGRALTVLSDATRSVYTPRTGAIERCFSWMDEQLLAQFSQKGKSVKTSFQGYKPDGTFFKVDVKPKDVKKGWYIQVGLSPRLPRDIESEVQTANLAIQPTGPNGEKLLSHQTAREEILKLRDPDAENDRVLAEYGMALPPIVIRNVAAALEKAGKPEIAAQVMSLEQQAPPQNGGGAAPEGPPQFPPEIIEQIATVFIQAGQEELGAAVLESLGVPIPGPNDAGPAPNGAVPAGV